MMPHKNKRANVVSCRCRAAQPRCFCRAPIDEPKSYTRCLQCRVGLHMTETGDTWIERPERC